jgi:hypothetical protein
MVGIGLILPPVPAWLAPPIVGVVPCAVLVLTPLLAWIWAVMAFVTVGGMLWLVASIGFSPAGHRKRPGPRWRPRPVPQQL